MTFAACTIIDCTGVTAALTAACSSIFALPVIRSQIPDQPPRSAIVPRSGTEDQVLQRIADRKIEEALFQLAQHLGQRTPEITAAQLVEDPSMADSPAC